MVKKKVQLLRHHEKNRNAAAASPARNPFNQGFLAAFLVLAVGVGLIVLGAMLPPLGTILVSWVLGGAVLLVGVGFLALTLMGFTVRIFG